MLARLSFNSLKQRKVNVPDKAGECVLVNVDCVCEHACGCTGFGSMGCLAHRQQQHSLWLFLLSAMNSIVVE